jgi:hypothetical protein
VGWNGSVFAAICRTFVATSPDGITWTQRNLSQSVYVNRIVNIGSKFCALAIDWADDLVTSPDGLTWTVTNAYDDAGLDMYGPIVADNSKFVLINSDGYSNRDLYTSTDGLSWTTHSNTGPQSYGPGYYYSTAYNGKIWCAVGDLTICTSKDGVTWTAQPLPGSADLSQIIWNGSIFCAVGFKGTMTSPDGINWTLNLNSLYVYDVAWNGSLFCAVAYGRIYSSTDGLNWTARLSNSSPFTSIEWNGSLFLAASRGDTSAATSPDGITWTSRTLPAATPSSQSSMRMSQNGSLFCIMTATSAITTRDGVSFTTTAMPGSETWNGVYWTGQYFFAVAEGTTAAKSTDGVNWKLVTLPFAANQISGVK